MCKEISAVVDTFFSKFQLNLGKSEIGYEKWKSTMYIGK